MRLTIASVLVAALLLPAVVAGQISLRRGRQSMPTVEYDSHFVFTRIRYGASLSRFGGGGWEHDYPTAERNFAEILDYITNMRVRKDGSNILDLDDSRIFENPVIYMSEPGYWASNDAEAKNLREYLLKGGLIIFDDFEGPDHWNNMAAQMRQALPEYQFLPIDERHPIFHSFYDILALKVPHPSMDVVPGYFAMFENNDPSRRMIALANHNNDIAEYWEWSAEGLYNPDPTSDAYRLGVNYYVYALTH